MPASSCIANLKDLLCTVGQLMLESPKAGTRTTERAFHGSPFASGREVDSLLAIRFVALTPRRLSKYHKAPTASMLSFTSPDSQSHVSEAYVGCQIVFHGSLAIHYRKSAASRLAAVLCAHLSRHVFAKFCLIFSRQAGGHMAGAGAKRRAQCSFRL